MNMKKGAAEWTPIYMLVVLIIAAVLVLTLVKPLFKRALGGAEENVEEAQTAAKAALFVGWFVLNRPKMR